MIQKGRARGTYYVPSEKLLESEDIAPVQGETIQPQGVISQLTPKVLFTDKGISSVCSIVSVDNAPVPGDIAPVPRDIESLELPHLLKEKINTLNRHVKVEQLQEIIVELCRLCPMGKNDLMKILDRKERTIKRLVTSLLGKELDYLYPMMPHHPR